LKSLQEHPYVLKNLIQACEEWDVEAYRQVTVIKTLNDLGCSQWAVRTVEIEEQPQMQYAAKFLVGDFTPEDKKLFLREVTSFSFIRNDNIIQAVGVSKYVYNRNDYTLLVMELAVTDLSSLLKPSGAINSVPPAEICMKITIGIARGMRHLHHLNIMHRDLKPANILVREEVLLSSKKLL
jgi:serine/threonine protein kinase